MWKILLIVALCGAAAALVNQDLDQEWETWKSKFNKSYPNKAEELRRREIWEKNHKMVTQHNLEYSKGMHTYNQAMNHLSDLTPEEVSGYLIPSRKRLSSV